MEKAGGELALNAGGASHRSQMSTKVRAAFDDERIQQLLHLWFGQIRWEFEKYGLWPRESDDEQEQRRKEKAGDTFVRNVRKWFHTGRRNYATGYLVEQAAALLGGRKLIATCYGVDISTVTRWANGTTPLPDHVTADIEDRWIDDLRPPSKDNLLSHSFIYTLNQIRRVVLKHKHFLQLNHEVWQMMTSAWFSKHWAVAEQIGDSAELDTLFNAIKQAVWALPETSGPDGKSPPEPLRVWNRLTLQGQMDEWGPILRLALGALSGEM